MKSKTNYTYCSIIFTFLFLSNTFIIANSKNNYYNSSSSINDRLKNNNQYIHKDINNNQNTYKNTNESKYKIPDNLDKLLEIFGFIIFVMYIINYIYGKYSNLNMIEYWNSSLNNIYTVNYAHIGFNKDVNMQSPFM